jgi:hypothetical protein
MKKQTVLAKKRRGPAPTGKGVQVVVRLQPAPLLALDNWATKQEDRPTRAEAIRRLVELGLTVKQPTAPSSKTAARAADLAAKVIDKSIAPGTPTEERETRKRRLIQGPSSLRGGRKDRAQ